MKKNITSHLHFYLLLSTITSLLSCNPDCTSIAGLRISTTMNAAGHEILISANPPESLKDRKVFFGNNEATQVRFQEGQGLVVRVPEDLEDGQVELRIQDLDCEGVVSLDFDVVDPTFFINNPDFVFPPLPEIIIPNLPVTDFPPSIENAWLSVNNLDYCMWFKFLKEVNINGDTVCSTNIDPARSFEQCFAGCLGFTNDADCLYDDNPLSGVIDPANNFVRVIVDRTRWGGGYEEFTGQFINPSETGIYEEWEAGDEPTNVAGLPINTTRDHMILLTSQLNGRKVLIYQQGLNVAAATTDCL
jgi:hypothetical protein